MLRKLLFSIYKYSPIFVQNLAISLYGLIIYYQRYGYIYRKYLGYYRERDQSALCEENVLQNQAFLELLHHAVAFSPFYKEFYKNIDLAKIRSIHDISQLPILTKEILKANIDKVYTISANRGLKFFTGGTTGAPMMVLKRREDVQRRMAYLDAYKLRFGFVNNKMRSARFFGKTIIPKSPGNRIFWRNNYISRQRFYSTYYLTPTNLKYYVDNLNLYRPQAIDGFVSAIYEIAKYINEHHIPLTFTPIAIFTTAETVLPLHREEIEKAFKCSLRDQYASNEGAPFITQCACGSYHENIDTGVFEHMPTTNGIKLLVTSFDTFGTPLIRYDIGDYVIETDQKVCACGSSHPLIGGIEGRDTDFLVSTRGGKINAANMSVFVSELPNSVENLQLIQLARDKIIIKIVTNDSFHKNHENVIRDLARSYVGQDMNIVIEEVINIERSVSGKFRLIINHVEDANG